MQLIGTARTLIAGDKGLLAMDESNPTCKRLFASWGLVPWRMWLELEWRCSTAQSGLCHEASTRPGAQPNAAAKEFIAFLQSPEGAAIFRKWGWIAATP